VVAATCVDRTLQRVHPVRPDSDPWACGVVTAQMTAHPGRRHESRACGPLRKLLRPGISVPEGSHPRTERVSRALHPHRRSSGDWTATR
jgi:hypothetical protein